MEKGAVTKVVVRRDEPQSLKSKTLRYGATVTKTPELVSQTREGQPEKLRRRLRGDLDNIVLKALEKEPERRYSSVAELAQDIDRHLRHLPVKARPSTLAYRASRLVQRHKVEVGAALIVMAVLAAAPSLTFNIFGLRDRVLGGVPITRIQSLKGAGSVKPRGWVASGAAGARPAVSCESLAGVDLPDTTITLAQSVPTGAFAPSGHEPIPNLPDFCRVEGVISRRGTPTFSLKSGFRVRAGTGNFVGSGIWASPD